MPWLVLVVVAAFLVLEGLAVALVVTSAFEHNRQHTTMGLVSVFFVPMLFLISDNPLSELVPSATRFLISDVCVLSGVVATLAFVLYAGRFHRR